MRSEDAGADGCVIASADYSPRTSRIASHFSGNAACSRADGLGMHYRRRRSGVAGPR